MEKDNLKTNLGFGYDLRVLNPLSRENKSKSKEFNVELEITTIQGVFNFDLDTYPVYEDEDLKDFIDDNRVKWEMHINAEILSKITDLANILFLTGQYYYSLIHDSMVDEIIFTITKTDNGYYKLMWDEEEIINELEFLITITKTSK